MSPTDLSRELFAQPTDVQRQLFRELSLRLGLPTTDEMALRSQALDAAVRISQNHKSDPAEVAWSLYEFLSGQPTE